MDDRGHELVKASRKKQAALSLQIKRGLGLMLHNARNQATCAVVSGVVQAKMQGCWLGDKRRVQDRLARYTQSKKLRIRPTLLESNLLAGMLVSYLLVLNREVAIHRGHSTPVPPKAAVSAPTNKPLNPKPPF